MQKLHQSVGCNGACQTAKADTNAHSTLDQGKFRKFITDFKILHNDQILTLDRKSVV